MSDSTSFLTFAGIAVMFAIPLVGVVLNPHLRSCASRLTNIKNIGINLIKYYVPIVKTVGSYKLIKLSTFHDSGISFREVKFITGSERGKSILLEQSVKTIDDNGNILVDGRDIYYDKSLPPAVLHSKPLRTVSTSHGEFEGVKNINSVVEYVTPKIFEE